MEMSHLSRGHSHQSVRICTEIRLGCPGCPWESPGHFRGIPSTKFLHVCFVNLLSFSLPTGPICFLQAMLACGCLPLVAPVCSCSSMVRVIAASLSGKVIPDGSGFQHLGGHPSGTLKGRSSDTWHRPHTMVDQNVKTVDGSARPQGN